MKPIFLRLQDDCKLLDAVGTSGKHNRKVTINKGIISVKYRRYRVAVKKPGAMKSKMKIPQELAEALAAKYKEGRDGKGAFSYIKEWAKNPGSVSCPYCGRKGLGTIDHYLPQEHFPVFSVFSPNMIPACHDCQGVKSSRYSSASERPIHPLLDRFGIAQEVIIQTRIKESKDLAESEFTFSSRPTHRKQPHRIRKKEARQLKKHYVFFKMADRDEVKNDCILELNALRSCLYEALPEGNLEAAQQWMKGMLLKIEANQDLGSTPFLRVALLRGFLTDEHAMIGFAQSNVPLATLTRSNQINLLKKR